MGRDAFLPLLELMPLCFHEQIALAEATVQLEFLRKRGWSSEEPMMYVMIMDQDDVLGRIPRQIKMLAHDDTVQRFLVNARGIFVFATANLTETVSRGDATPRTKIEALFYEEAGAVVVVNASDGGGGGASDGAAAAAEA